MAEATVQALRSLETAEPCYRLFVDWCRKAPDDFAFRSRFKIMGMGVNWTELGLPTLIESYNGKPTLISHSGTLHVGPGRSYMEMGINVFIFNYIARKTLDSFRGKMRDAVFDFGGTIEARSDDELPERMLFAARLTKCDLFRASTGLLLPETLDWFQREREAGGQPAAAAAAAAAAATSTSSSSPRKS